MLVCLTLLCRWPPQPKNEAMRYEAKAVTEYVTSSSGLSLKIQLSVSDYILSIRNVRTSLTQLIDTDWITNCVKIKCRNSRPKQASTNDYYLSTICLSPSTAQEPLPHGWCWYSLPHHLLHSHLLPQMLHQA